MLRKGFSLIETLVVISTISLLFTAALPSLNRFFSLLLLDAETKTLASDLRALQSTAMTQRQSKSLDLGRFAGANRIKIAQNNRITFAPSGAAAFGRSGTLTLRDQFGHLRKIIVSSAGRIRVE